MVADALVRALFPAAVLTGTLAAGALLPASAEAKVRILTRPDGSRVIFDDPSPQPPRYTSSSLRSPSGEIADLIEYYAHDRGLSPRLVQAVIQIESAYDSRARSRKGAMGLMQLMPDTARLLRVSDPYDPAQNIRGGTLYLRRQLDRFDGDLTLALAAYNAGPTAVTDYGGVPPYPETRNYVRKVLSLYRGVGAPAAGIARDSARSPAGRPTESASRQAERQQRGAKVYMSRGANNRIIFTTAPPKTN